MRLRTVSQPPRLQVADAEDFFDTFLLAINTFEELERFLGIDFINKGKQPEE